MAEGQGTSSYNLFVYCGDNPIMYADQSGKVATEATILVTIAEIVYDGLATGSRAWDYAVENGYDPYESSYQGFVLGAGLSTASTLLFGYLGKDLSGWSSSVLNIGNKLFDYTVVNTLSDHLFHAIFPTNLSMDLAANLSTYLSNNQLDSFNFDVDSLAASTALSFANYSGKYYNATSASSLIGQLASPLVGHEYYNKHLSGYNVIFSHMMLEAMTMYYVFGYGYG